MVDFKKRLAGKRAEKPVDPVKLYDTLDRAHDKAINRMRIGQGEPALNNLRHRTLPRSNVDKS